MNKNNDNDIHDEAEEPDVNVFKVSCFGKGRINRGQESCQYKKTSQCTHEAVGEVGDIDVESKVSDDPQEERLKKSS